MLINRLINDPFLHQTHIKYMLDKVDQVFYKNIEQFKSEQFEFLKDQKAFDLDRTSALEIFTLLLQGRFFILRQDIIVGNSIIRDPLFFKFVDDNSDILLYAVLMRLIDKSHQEGCIAEADVNSLNNSLWDYYLDKNPHSTLYKDFQKDPRIEILIHQEKMNILESIYASLD